MHFHQMAHAPLDGSIQFFGVNMVASTFCAAVFPVIALPDRIIIGGRMPGFSSVPTATVTADDFIGNGREGAIPADGVRPCGLHFLFCHTDLLTI